MNIAVIGTGNFSEFSVKQFAKHPDINVIAVFDTSIDKAKKFQKKFGGKICTQFEQITTNSDIEMVYIATPPWLHYEQSKQCLLANKHVICEKPAALTSTEAQELIKLASSKKLLYVVNLMQRYNPFFLQIKKIIDEKLLGEFLHGFFENYASDEFLPEDHWFWDENKSGGIFIEHGVHFFDLFEGWLGKGKLLSSYEIKRKKTLIANKAADRVQACIAYDKGNVNFYHGFDQTKVLDRQEIRLVFERGNINLYEWVPTHLKLEGIVTKKELAQLMRIFSRPNIEITNLYEKDMLFKGRFKNIVPDYKIILGAGHKNKTQCYQNLLYEMITDQIAWIHDNTHPRRITEKNALESLQLAEKAHKKALVL